MARPYKELREKMSPEAQERARKLAEQDLVEMNLRELRKSVEGLTQDTVGDLLRVTQSAIAQLESREDMLISKLAAYVNALGGSLELVARFPDQADVRITQFDEVRKQLAEAG